MLERVLSEIQDRPVWQVAGLYLGFSWIVLQVIDVLADNLDLPGSIFRSALILLAIGFVIVLTTAFVQRGAQSGDSGEASRLRSIFSWRNAVVVGVAAFAVWGVVSAILLTGAGRQVPSAIEAGTDPANTLVVLPFSYQGDDDHAYLSDGIVDLLSTKLDGAGELRAVDPRAILSFSPTQSQTPLGPTEAASAAENFGARFFVLGNIVEVGDRLTLTAALYDRTSGLTPVEEADATGEATAVFESVDRLAAQLLSGIGSGPAARVQQVAAVSTGSLPALRAYLAGEEAYRLGQYQQAVASFQEATELDSAYALAYYRLSIVAEFSTLSALAQQSAELAVAHADRLSDRDRALLEAFLAWRRGAHAEAEELYRSLVRAYPDEVEAWFELGEVLMHGNPLHGRSFDEAWDPLQRVLELDPQNTGAMYHLARIASVSGRFEELDSLVRVHNALNPGGDRELEVTALQAYARPNPTAQQEILARLRAGTDVGVALAGWDVSTWTEDVDGARDVVSVLTDPTRPTEVRTLGHAWLSQVELAAGRISSTRQHLEQVAALDTVAALEYGALLAANPLMEITEEDLRANAARLEALQAEEIAPSDNPSVFYSVHDNVHPLLRTYLLGVTYGLLGDSAQAYRYAAETEQMSTGPSEGTTAADLAASVRAQSLWRAGKLDEALEALQTATREVWYNPTLSSPFYGQALERYLMGELLFESGRLEEAVPWFANISQIAPYELAFRGLAYERLAQIHETLGRTAEAVEYSRRLVSLWRDADPELEPRVAEAQERIERLSG